MPYPSLQELPTTPEQWRITAQAAAGLLLIHSAKEFGFITGGPDIDPDRCDEIVALAAAQGIEVGIDQATEAGLDLIAGFNEDTTDA